MERLEEGLHEIPPDMNQHVRVSEYLKRKPSSNEDGNPHDSILVDTAVSTMINESDNTSMSENIREARVSNTKIESDPSYSKIDDSYF